MEIERGLEKRARACNNTIIHCRHILRRQISGAALSFSSEIQIDDQRQNRKDKRTRLLGLTVSGCLFGAVGRRNSARNLIRAIADASLMVEAEDQIVAADALNPTGITAKHVSIGTVIGVA